MESAPVPTYMPRAGTALVTRLREVKAEVFNVIEVCRRAKAHPTIGPGYGAWVYVYVSQTYPQGVSEDQLDAVLAHLAAASSDQAGDAPLRAAGGSQ